MGKITKPLLYDMKVICGWCDKELDTKKAVSPGRVSHGMCETRKENLLKEHEAFEKKVA